MRKQSTWLTVHEIFTALNDAGCIYAVLRNYECMESGNPFTNGHDDIDIICNDLKLVQNVLGVHRRFLFPAVNSYYAGFKDYRVNVDIRFVGDGYYDTLWEEDMLANRILFNDCIYVLDPINYFYSLAYHALLQKEHVSDDYQEKLLAMAKKLDVPCQSVQELPQILENYMDAKGYYYTITKDPGIILKFEGVDKKRIKKNYFWLFRRHILNLLRRNRRIAQKYV
ncbi:MAG: hypothetical protein HFH82_13850 [Lachnospiraceae bacterium]|nr:hypothetical protein [Lachnospiraceae bacterium]